VYHNGRWHGSNASFARLPDEKATIIVLGNKFNRNIYWSGYLAYNIFGDYFPKKQEYKEDDVNPENKPFAKTKNPVYKRSKSEPEKTKR
jgi:hypothetical protein